MPCTLDAAALTLMGQRGQLKICLVDGPLALDNAINEEAAKTKKITSPVAGKADILLVPTIDDGNMLAKSIVYFSRNETAGLIIGAAAPVILTSRADSPRAKLLSIAAAVMMAHHS
jgi:phosphate butyryltransferase